jgi:hypothetical protein
MGGNILSLWELGEGWQMDSLNGKTRRAVANHPAPNWISRFANISQIRPDSIRLGLIEAQAILTLFYEGKSHF